jgi:lysophospholipase L1-like esterase
VVLLTLGLGEGAARIAGVRPLTAADRLWRAHERWGWHHEPNSTDLFVKLDFAQEIHINSHGLREREIPYEKPAGVLRILMIGDSYTAGFEVKEEERFSRVVEDRLVQRGDRVQVINAGTRGWGTDQSLLFLQDEGVRYAPDLVVYVWNANDLTDNQTIHRPFRVYGKPWFVARPDGSVEPRGIPVPRYRYREDLRVGPDGEPLVLSVPLRSQATLWLRDVLVCRSAFATWLTRVAIGADALRDRMQKAGSFDDAADVSTTMDADSEPFRATAGMLRAMQRSAREAGARFVLAAAGPELEAMRAAAEVPKLDDLDRFRARIHPGDQLFIPNDPHMNALGHRLYGEALAEALLAAGYVEPRAARSPPVAIEPGRRPADPGR